MATSASPPNPIKILLVGDKATGKHCYAQHLLRHRFANDTRTTSEYDVVSIQVQVDENTHIPVQLWSVASSQRGKSTMKQHYQNVDGFIIMFDLTEPGSFDNVLGWKTDLDELVESKNPPSILLANKCDHRKHKDLQGTMEMMDEYCHALGFLTYFETSAKTNQNIEASMQTLIREVIRRRADQPVASPVTPSVNSTPVLEENREFTFKIVVIGEMATGKSALIERYVKNTFSENYRATVGSDIGFKKIRYNDNVIIRLHLWDIAGEERFGGLTPLFYRDAAGCLVVFDVNRPSTLDNGAVKWKNDFDSNVELEDGGKVPCLLLGNKCDLMKEGSVTSQTHMEKFCEKHRFLRWFETSAKENINISTAIQCLVQEILRRREMARTNGTASTRAFSLVEQDDRKTKSNICCK